LEMQQRETNCVALSFDERFQRVVDYLYQEKYNARIQRLIQLSKFRLPKAEKNDNYYDGRGLIRNAIQELATNQFMHSRTNVIFQGFTGSGKTFLACALGKQACKQQVRTRYVRLPDLLRNMTKQRLQEKPICGC
jgi:DNA replication protein DnaC